MKSRNVQRQRARFRVHHERHLLAAIADIRLGFPRIRRTAASTSAAAIARAVAGVVRLRSICAATMAPSYRSTSCCASASASRARPVARAR
jgi:hypothetical protein